MALFKKRTATLPVADESQPTSQPASESTDSDSTSAGPSYVSSYTLTDDEFDELRDLLGDPKPENISKSIKDTKRKMSDLADKNAKAVAAGKKASDTLKSAEKRAKEAERQVTDLEEEVERLKGQIKELKAQLAASTGVNSEERDLSILTPAERAKYDTLSDEAVDRLVKMNEIYEPACDRQEKRKKATRFSMLC